MKEMNKTKKPKKQVKVDRVGVLHLGVTVSSVEMNLAKKYHQNLSATMRYLLQKDLARIVFDDEFLELVEKVPVVVKKRLEEIRVSAGKRIYSETDLKEIRDAEIVA
jgi:hypothetical protein